MPSRSTVEQARVAGLVTAALEHYAGGQIALARDGIAAAFAIAPDDARIARLHRWLLSPVLDAPLWPSDEGESLVSSVGVAGDTFDQFESIGDLQSPSMSMSMSMSDPAAPAQEMQLTNSAVQRLLEVADDGMPGFAPPQLTPVPTLEPMRPEKTGSPDAVRGSDYDFVEIEAEATGSRMPPQRHPEAHSMPLPMRHSTAPAARTPTRNPTGTVRAPSGVSRTPTGPTPRAPTGSTPTRPPSEPRQPQGTLLGVMGPSLLGPADEMLAPNVSETAPELSAVESLLGGDFAPPPVAPLGQEPLHRIAPNEITSVKSRPTGLTGTVEPRRKTGEARRSSSGRRTNPYLRRSPEDVQQALDDLRLAVEANAGLEAFELAERAIEILAGMPLEPEQQDLLVDAYQLAIGALDQPVRHGTVPATLDPRIAFLLSRIDGLTSVDELLEISGMPRFEAVRLLAQLVRQGVVEF